MNLVETVRGHATPKFAESISAVLGITPERIGLTLDAAIPSLVAAIAARAQTPEDAHSLARTLREVDEAVLVDPSTAVRTHGAALMNRGADLLGGLIGGAALTALIGAIGRYTGKSPGSVRSIVGLLAPVVLAAVKREHAAAELDEARLARLLEDQKPQIVAAVPQGLIGYLASAPNVGALGEYLRIHAGAAAHHGPSGPPRPLIHRDPTPAPSAAPHRTPEPSRRSGAVTHAAHPTPAHTNGQHYQYHPRKQRVPTWAWAFPAVGVLGLGWLIVLSMGSSSVDAADAEAPRVVSAAAAPAAPAASTPATDTSVDQEIDAIIDATAATLGVVRDAATAEAAAPKLKDLSARLNAAKRAYAKLPPNQRRAINDRVSDALSTRLRNAFERINGSEEARRLLGPITEELQRTLQQFRPE